MGKYFEVETDHNNLRWIEASLNPAIIRMRIFMQGYHFDVRHIPGKLNIAADYLSRYHLDEKPPSKVEVETTAAEISENFCENSRNFEKSENFCENSKKFRNSRKFMAT